MSNTADKRPTIPPTMAPVVVRPRQYILRINRGKLVEAPIANVKLTRYAIFCRSNAIPNKATIIPNAIAAIFDSRICLC